MVCGFYTYTNGQSLTDRKSERPTPGLDGCLAGLNPSLPFHHAGSAVELVLLPEV